MALLVELRPPEPLLLSADRVETAVPVVRSTVLDARLVWARVWPLLTVVMMVVNSSIPVETRALVLRIGVEARVEVAKVEESRASVVLAVVDDGRLGDDCVCDASGVVSASDVESMVLGAGVEDGSGVVEGSSDDDASSLVDGAADEEAPVPSACRLMPWWR